MTWVLMFRYFRYYGGLQWSPLAHVLEPVFRQVSPQIVWRPWLSYLRELVPDLYASYIVLHATLRWGSRGLRCFAGFVYLSTSVSSF